MGKKAEKKPMDLRKELSGAQILAICDIIDGDGHTIFKPAAFLNEGIPLSVVEEMSEVFESDTSDPRSTIFDNNNNVMEKLQGVYGLRFLSRIARDFELESPGCLGRGFQARALTKVIREHFGVPQAKEA